MRKGHRIEIAGITGALACLVMIIFCGSARAEWGMGNLKIYPEFSVAETYRSNIYQTQSDRKSDWITTTRAGARMEYKFGAKHMLTMGYNAGFLNYTHNTTNNYWDHVAHSLLSLNFPGGLEVNLGTRFLKSTIEQTATVAHTRPYERSFTDFSTAYRFADRWKAEAKYNREQLSFDHTVDKGQNFWQNLYGGVMYYRFTARTSALTEYNYVQKTFPNNRVANSSSNNMYFGVAFDPAGKLRGDFKAGYGWKQFDHDLATRDNSPKNWIMAANLIQDFTKYTSVSFNAARSFYDDTDFGNASYIGTGAGATFQHFFTQKIGSTATAIYRYNEYLDYNADPVTAQQKKRVDKRWDFGVGAIYRMNRWIEGRLEYQYITKNSNFETYSFDENRVMLKIIVTP
ncbi:MAG TPA: outer membrane beta-barrel protein [Syntrophorhabdaceae bacterium]